MNNGPRMLPLRRLLARNGRALLDAVAPRRCRLCHVIVAGDCALCDVCRGELLHNRCPCARCALPLPLPPPVNLYEAQQSPGEAAKRVPSSGWATATITARDRLCPRCLHRAPALTGARAPFVYDEALAFLLGRWKYHGEVALVRTLARLWLDAVPDPPAVDLLLPVPLHWRRLLARGFNQSADLAELLGAALGVRANPRRPTLRRITATPAQAQAGRRDRLRNLRGAFALRGDVSGLCIALVDDVCTTGATAEAAARALLHGGAAEVHLWCIARTAAYDAAFARATLSR